MGIFRQPKPPLTPATCQTVGMKLMPAHAVQEAPEPSFKTSHNRPCSECRERTYGRQSSRAKGILLLSLGVLTRKAFMQTSSRIASLYGLCLAPSVLTSLRLPSHSILSTSRAIHKYHSVSGESFTSRLGGVSHLSVATHGSSTPFVSSRRLYSRQEHKL